jgi:aspartate/methionine/tyrosine aminotransferase
VPDRSFTDAQIDAAVEALSDPQRFREAEAQIARLAPQLQRILIHALEEGGWFGEAHDGQVLKAATTPDPDERITAVKTLLAEETRIGMMVGVAVGWELRKALTEES